MRLLAFALLPPFSMLIYTGIYGIFEVTSTQKLRRKRCPNTGSPEISPEGGRSLRGPGSPTPREGVRERRGGRQLREARLSGARFAHSPEAGPRRSEAARCPRLPAPHPVQKLFEELGTGTAGESTPSCRGLSPGGRARLRAAAPLPVAGRLRPSEDALRRGQFSPFLSPPPRLVPGALLVLL